MIRSVPLSRLPQDLVFPAALESRIRFDAARKLLQFDGFMSKRDFDKLLVLHNDIEYQRALERLFQICVFQAEEPRRHSARWLVYLGAVAAILLVSTCSLLLYWR